MAKSKKISRLPKKKRGMKDLEKKFTALYDKYMAKEFSKMGAKVNLTLQPVSEIHLYSDLATDTSNKGDIAYIYIFLSE